MVKTQGKSIFERALLKTRVRSANVKPAESLLGYLVGPFCAMLANGIFTTYLTRYFRDVLFAEELAAGSALAGTVETFLLLFPILSAILIVIGNLMAGQLVERTRTGAGKARPWILLSSVLLAVSCVLIFIQPFENATAKMVWLVIAYNLYYAIAFPLYNTANSTLTPLSTRNPNQRSVLASFVNMSLLGAVGAGSMVFPFLLGILVKPEMSLGTQKTFWMILFIIVAVITFLGTVLQYYFTRERVTLHARTRDGRGDARRSGEEGGERGQTGKGSRFGRLLLGDRHLLLLVSVQRRYQERIAQLLCGAPRNGRSHEGLHHGRSRYCGRGAHGGLHRLHRAALQ